MDHCEIARRFNAAPGIRYSTVLLGGAAEPVYVPGCAARPAEIHYTRDYPQSALHELAHWCIAGPQRRARPDYGYWYQPPPRGPIARDRFFAVETRVQGLELLFARATGVRFHVSVDDPGSDPGDFEARVVAQAQHWLRRGFPERTVAVFEALGPDWQGRVAVTHD